MTAPMTAMDRDLRDTYREEGFSLWPDPLPKNNENDIQEKLGYQWLIYERKQDFCDCLEHEGFD